MRTNQHLLRMCLILFFALSTLTLSAQQVRTITLFVNTSEVSKDNTAVSCNFGQPEGVTNEDYTIDVRVGDIIVWKGVSTSDPENDIVDIKAINHEGGVNVFDRNVLRGNGQSPETVSATIVQGAPGSEEKYKLSFKVYNNGKKRNGTFHIDPKIRIQR